MLSSARRPRKRQLRHERRKLWPSGPAHPECADGNEGRIAQRYPQAVFEAGLGEDPDGVYLTATVDVQDTTEVFDVVVDRLIDMQVEEGLPIYVVPVQPLERVLEHMRALKHGARLPINWEPTALQP